MSPEERLPERYHTTSVSPKKAAAVTGALAGVGAVAGGITASIGATILLIAGGEFQLFSLVVPALVGGALGLVMGPALAWLFFRTIPIGRAVLGTSLAALAGAGVVAIAAPGSIALLLVGAVAGAVAGAAGMWLADRLGRGR